MGAIERETKKERERESVHTPPHWFTFKVAKTGKSEMVETQCNYPTGLW